MTTVLEFDAQTAASLERAITALSGRRIAVLTGAGVSTDSGIPDYRGKGAPTRTPMTVQQFLADESSRRRYWVGSHLGWRTFAAARPNAGHEALAALETAGVVTGVITQNVDGLHLRAGSRRVVELHGTMRRVLCLHCGQVFDRRDLATRVEHDNPWIAVPDAVELGPDGDVLPASTDGFIVPTCSVCEGMLKPEVVDAVRGGTFHIWSVDTIEQGIEILTGKKAGIRKKDGSYPKGTIYALVDERLKNLAQAMAQFGKDDNNKKD